MRIARAFVQFVPPSGCIGMCAMLGGCAWAGMLMSFTYALLCALGRELGRRVRSSEQMQVSGRVSHSRRVCSSDRAGCAYHLAGVCVCARA